MSKIEWTDKAWNIITGCSVLSAGCTNCYAMREAAIGRPSKHFSRVGLTENINGNHVWNGKLRFNKEWLDRPLSWKKPRRIFVCAAGDPFHEAVLSEWLDLIYGIMALTERHQYQILTKRPDIMQEYNERLQHRPLEIMAALVNHFGSDYFKETDLTAAAIRLQSGPLSNVWHGASIENQKTADERIAPLLATPSAVHWVSYEPALGGVNLRAVKPFLPAHEQLGYWMDALRGNIINAQGGIVCEAPGRLDWVVAGGESGPNARPPFPDWFHEMQRSCEFTGVSFNFKQWGVWRPATMFKDGEPIPLPKNSDKKLALVGQDGKKIYSIGAGRLMEKVSKKAAGRLLDGVVYDEYPREI